MEDKEYISRCSLKIVLISVFSKKDSTKFPKNKKGLASNPGQKSLLVLLYHSGYIFYPQIL